MKVLPKRGIAGTEKMEFIFAHEVPRDCKFAYEIFF